jgi:hypothetical protein
MRPILLSKYFLGNVRGLFVPIIHPDEGNRWGNISTENLREKQNHMQGQCRSCCTRLESLKACFFLYAQSSVL